MKEHRSIVSAYEKGEENLLTRAVEDHLAKFKENILASDLLKNKGSK